MSFAQKYDILLARSNVKLMVFSITGESPGLSEHKLTWQESTSFLKQMNITTGGQVLIKSQKKQKIAKFDNIPNFY